VSSLRVMGRATQGVRLINIGEADEIAAVTKVDHVEEEEGAENNTAENYGNENTPASDTETSNENGETPTE
ncbi:MAG TPA: DNA gyrase C-terminal beta-propeller domain-containing protein, partial [Bacteroidia bacterium]